MASKAAAAKGNGARASQHNAAILRHGSQRFAIPRRRTERYVWRPARLGHANHSRGSLLQRTLAVARLACPSTGGTPPLPNPALAVLARTSAPPTHPSPYAARWRARLRSSRGHRSRSKATCKYSDRSPECRVSEVNAQQNRYRCHRTPDLIDVIAKALIDSHRDKSKYGSDNRHGQAERNLVLR